MSRRAWGLFAALSIIWGLPYLLIKVAVVDFSPAQIVFVRTLLGAAVIVPLVIHQKSLRKLKGVWVWVLAFAALEITGPFWLIGAAEQQVPSSLAAITIATVPMIGAFSAWALRIDDRVTLTRFVGLIVGFVVIVGDLTSDQAKKLANLLTAQLPQGQAAPAIPPVKPITASSIS